MSTFSFYYTSLFSGVLTIVHCKILLQKVAEVIHAEKQHSVSSVIDSSLLDRLHCQLERTRTTVDHCLTLQLYLGNRLVIYLDNYHISL